MTKKICEKKINERRGLEHNAETFLNDGEEKNVAQNFSEFCRLSQI